MVPTRTKIRIYFPNPALVPVLSVGTLRSTTQYPDEIQETELGNSREKIQPFSGSNNGDNYSLTYLNRYPAKTLILR